MASAVLNPMPRTSPRKPVRVLGHDLHGVGAVGLEDAHRSCRPDAVAVQEHHDLAHHLLLRPGLGNALRTDRADAVHLPQAPGLLLNDIKHAFSECPDQLAGIHRPIPRMLPEARYFSIPSVDEAPSSAGSAP